MQTPSSDENSLSVCQTRDLSQNETMIIMSRSLVFREENSWWGQPILSEILGQPAPFEQNRRISVDININRKSTTRFPMSLRWTAYVAPKSYKGAQKRKTAGFPLKSHLLEESLLQSLFVWNCQRQSRKAFIGLTIRANMIGGDVPFCVKIWRILTHPLAKRSFSIYFRS